MRLVLPLILLALLAPSAHAYPKLPEPLPPVAGNPADRLADEPIEYSVYDRATKCRKRTRPGVVALTQWLQANMHGVFWGSYRCEKWGRKSASLHAENRAIDWHLDASVRADQRAADGLFRLLLAPDRRGNPQALARRMGVQELIWDCGYWGAGMANFRPYSPCYTRRGKRRRGVDRTTAHKDHIHIGMSKDGAMARTSFWQAR
ncbi:MAG: hypothetical protein ACRDPC_26035 [Solirubrobacteraceae bacterium]